MTSTYNWLCALEDVFLKRGTIAAAHEENLLRLCSQGEASIVGGVACVCGYVCVEQPFNKSLLLFQPAVLLGLCAQLAHSHVLARHVCIHHGRWYGKRKKTSA